MSKGEKLHELSARYGAAKRPRYEPRSYLASWDLVTEQRYRRQQLRRHNRYLHGWGIVFGLWVIPANDQTRPWAVQICPGFALGPHGDEIGVPEPALVSVHDALWQGPKTVSMPNVYIGIRDAEQALCPVPSKHPRCSCEETVYQPSRVRESFQVEVLSTMPEAYEAEAVDICTPDPSRCPDCPDRPYVLLARIRLPNSTGDPITRAHIDNGVRRPPI
jgi:hypothetical protein